MIEVEYFQLENECNYTNSTDVKILGESIKNSLYKLIVIVGCSRVKFTSYSLLKATRQQAHQRMEFDLL